VIFITNAVTRLRDKLIRRGCALRTNQDLH
jgi:hypothetical protein